MTVSTLEYLKEQARQKKTGDTNFLKRLLYFFELIVPAEKMKNGEQLNFLFPLIIPPESITMSEPFAVEATETLGGGLYVEENGIIQRNLTLKGNTGFMPRNLQTTANGPGGNFLKQAARASLGALINLGVVTGKPDLRAMDAPSYSRKLPIRVLAAISGPRHFQYLQDAVFRTYADLKKDPVSSAGTSLRFHNPKDEEHWEVVPMRFELERDKGKNRFLYNYNIELLVVGPAEEAEFNYMEDKTLLEQFNDKVRTVKKGVDLVTGALNDLTRLTAEIRKSISNIVVLIDAVNRINSAANDFINGVTRLIDSTHAIVVATRDLMNDSLHKAYKLERSGKTRPLPDTVVHTFRQVDQGLAYISSSPSVFADSTESKISEIKNRQNKYSIDEATVAAAINETSPGSFSELEKKGTALTSGEAIAVSGSIDVGGNFYNYSSAIKVPIMAGDTLVSLAAKYMGDARLWQYIAILNDLKPPFVSDMASVDLSKRSDDHPFNNSFGIGDYILIPSNSAPTNSYSSVAIVGTDLSESVENHVFGTTFALDPIYDKLDTPVTYFSNNVKYDIPINTETGSTDVKYVSGKKNLVQALILRIVTEKGSSPLFKKFGLSRIVSMGFTPSDLENAKYRIRETILSDPRVDSIESFDMTQDADCLINDLVVSVRGFSDSTPLNFTLRN